MKLPSFPRPRSLLLPRLAPAPWVSDPQAQLPCSTRGWFLPSCLSSWPALACVLATWSLSSRFTFPVCGCGSIPLCSLTLDKNVACHGMAAGSLGYSVLVHPGRCSVTKTGRPSSGGWLPFSWSELTSEVALRSPCCCDVIGINSGLQGLLGDRNMVLRLRSQNSDPLCGILGNVPVSFKPCYHT